MQENEDINQYLKMRQIRIILLGITVIFSSCAPKISTSISKNYGTLDSKMRVNVFDLNDSVPLNTEVLGYVKIGDTGFSTNCSWDVVIDKAKNEARQVGGNAIKIVDHRPPSLMGSTCHRIKAIILKVSNSEIVSMTNKNDSLSNFGDVTAAVYNDSVIENIQYPKFRFAINGGWSTRVAKLSDNIPEDFRQYSKELKSGFSYGLDLSYYFFEQAGFGLMYNVYRSQNSIDNVNVISPTGYISGRISDDISIGFVGAFYSTRLLNATKKNSLLLNMGIGYMGYKNNGVLISDYATLKGSTLGICWDIGYDIGISKNIAIGFQLSSLIGTLTKYELSSRNKTEIIKLEKDNYESLSRIDLSIGLRFIK